MNQILREYIKRIIWAAGMTALLVVSTGQTSEMKGLDLSFGEPTQGIALSPLTVDCQKDFDIKNPAPLKVQEKQNSWCDHKGVQYETSKLNTTDDRKDSLTL
jgi:hypothetical protein